MMRLKQTLNQWKIYSVFEFKHHAAAYSYGSKSQCLARRLFARPFLLHGVHTSPTKALHCKTFLYYFQRLGMASGMVHILAPYVIRRRGTGNELRYVYNPYQRGLNLWT